MPFCKTEEILEMQRGTEVCRKYKIFLISSWDYYKYYVFLKERMKFQINNSLAINI